MLHQAFVMSPTMKPCFVVGDCYFSHLLYFFQHPALVDLKNIFIQFFLFYLGGLPDYLLLRPLKLNPQRQ